MFPSSTMSLSLTFFELSCLSIEVISNMFRNSLRRICTLAIRNYHWSIPLTRVCLHTKIVNSNRVILGSHRLIHLTVKLLEEIEVKTPEFPESITEGDAKWLKKVGDAVKAEEIVMEIETEKTAIPVPAPADGVIVEQYVKQDQVINPNTKLFKLKVEPKK